MTRAEPTFESDGTCGVIRSEAEIAGIARAGALLWSSLQAGARAIEAGATPLRLAAIVEEHLAAGGGVAVMKGMRGGGGVPFPAAAAVCVNEHLAHAVPTERALAAGDLVRIDAAVSLDGWCADAAIARTVGRPHRLEVASRRVLAAVIGAIGPGVRWSEVAALAGAVARGEGVWLVPGFAGHGIGRGVQEGPAYPIPQQSPDRGGNGGVREQDFRLTAGMVFTVEPIVSERPSMPVLLKDGWTWATRSGVWACHEERTVAVTGRGVAVLAGPAPERGGIGSKGMYAQAGREVHV